jgi:UDP-N-acetyl-2-amino-2-deoxyglucuronate dehydrogenase
MKNFALIGAAGYIAVRHLKAIKDTENKLVAALDKNDSVGILDSYFPQADFFTEYERFDRHIDKISRTEKKLDYISICTPNYLHDSHIRTALKHDAHAICEKPLTINPWNLEGLIDLEKQTGRKVYTVLQLRLHETIKELKRQIDAAPKDKIFDIDLTYITSRGHWYFASWKGEEQKSGGLTANIGVHFFDMLAWIFGKMVKSTVHVYEPKRASGFLELERARVRWFLSVDAETLPTEIRKKSQTTYRSILLNGKEIEFSEGFTNLHTELYKNILAGNGQGIKEAQQSLEIVHAIRHAQPLGLQGDYHPFAKKEIEFHPFYKNRRDFSYYS